MSSKQPFPPKKGNIARKYAAIVSAPKGVPRLSCRTDGPETARSEVASYSPGTRGLSDGISFLISLPIRRSAS